MFDNAYKQIHEDSTVQMQLELKESTQFLNTVIKRISDAGDKRNAEECILNKVVLCLYSDFMKDILAGIDSNEGVIEFRRVYTEELKEVKRNMILVKTYQGEKAAQIIKGTVEGKS